MPKQRPCSRRGDVNRTASRAAIRITVLIAILSTTGVLSGTTGPSPVCAGNDASTLETALGVLLGSVDGALIARAATIRSERTPAMALVYAGAVCGGAAIGYAVADNEDALTAMGIVLIPLAVLNWVLPPPNPTDLDPRLPARDGMLVHAMMGLVPRPATGGVRVAPLELRF